MVRLFIELVDYFVFGRVQLNWNLCFQLTHTKIYLEISCVS